MGTSRASPFALKQVWFRQGATSAHVKSSVPTVGSRQLRLPQYSGWQWLPMKSRVGPGKVCKAIGNSWSMKSRLGAQANGITRTTRLRGQVRNRVMASSEFGCNKVSERGRQRAQPLDSIEYRFSRAISKWPPAPQRCRDVLCSRFLSANGGASYSARGSAPGIRMARRRALKARLSRN
jgi:hypothetical protein